MPEDHVATVGSLVVAFRHDVDTLQHHQAWNG
jgi:hypothetical protein